MLVCSCPRNGLASLFRARGQAGLLHPKDVQLIPLSSTSPVDTLAKYTIPPGRSMASITNLRNGELDLAGRDGMRKSFNRQHRLRLLCSSLRPSRLLCCFPLASFLRAQGI